jgi:adenylyltransferase/sulfurtransferase
MTAAIGMTKPQILRYSRHMLLSEVGMEGQKKLMNASVLVIGAGGLGSPSLLYLAAAGVGRIGIVDDDQIELSNLQRQVLHTTERIGAPKAESAALTLSAINPEVTIEPHRLRLDTARAMELFPRYDLIIDGSDNFATRYAVNDAAYWCGKPLVSGAVIRFDGQLSLFAPDGREKPCYRCVFPQIEGDCDGPNCATAGVFGAIAGVIGTLQAAEAVKQLLGLGESLAGTLLLYDALGTSLRRIAVARDADCALCGDHPTILRPPALAAAADEARVEA